VGAFLGSVPGWLVARGLGATLGAVVGAAALATVGVAATSSTAPPATGAGSMHQRQYSFPQGQSRVAGVHQRQYGHPYGS
jgi:hypothetical protein